MESVKQFNDFLNDHVNLGIGSLELLDRNVDAIYAALKADEELKPLIVKKDPQGSWAHRTIIKPQKGKEFDADFMLVMKENEDWTDPVEYRNAIKRALNRHDKYKTMPVSHSCRAVTVTYADSHVDIVPFVALSDGRDVIVNGDDNEWEDSDPQSFTDWMRERDDITGRNFRKVVRIMKYLRDNSDWAGTKSIILTTLLGDRVSLGLHPEHMAFQHLAGARTQGNAGRQPCGQPRCTDLVKTRMDPQTLGVDHFHHGLARNNGGAGVGIAHGDHAIHRRDQAQIAPLRHQRFAV